MGVLFAGKLTNVEVLHGMQRFNVVQLNDLFPYFFVKHSPRHKTAR